MAAVLDAKENAEVVLKIYAHFRSEPGHVLLANNFLAVATRRGISVRELRDGIEDAVRAGWLEDGPNGSLRLTEQGFKRMREIGVER